MVKSQSKKPTKENNKNKRWVRIIVGAFFIILAAYTILATFQGGFQEYTERLFHCAQVEQTK